MELCTNETNTAYTRFVYYSQPALGQYVQSFSTIQNGAGEAYSINVFDGWGGVRISSSDHPNSTGGYSTVQLKYDSMGRVTQRSNPTEINSSFIPAGDDAITGWVWTLQTYDWKGRPLVTTNPDGSTRENIYGGAAVLPPSNPKQSRKEPVIRRRFL